MSTRRLAPLRKARPALRWSFQRSPSAFMMPLPRSGQWRECLPAKGGRRLTEQVPRPLLHKLALGKQALILEDKVQVPGAVDEHARWQSRHAQGDGLVAELALALVEPVEQLPAGLQKLDAVSDEGKGVWWFSNFFFFFLAWESGTLIERNRVSPQRLPIPSNCSPRPGKSADKDGEDDDSEDVVPILDDEAHVASCRRVREVCRELGGHVGVCKVLRSWRL